MEAHNYITRKGKFDAAHRVLNERFKCFNLHGHEYHYELVFRWEESLALGYAIDFKEIKRVVGEWIDTRFDHGFLGNPADTEILGVCKKLGLKTHLMHGLPSREAGENFCNPSAENIAKEMFYAGKILLGSTNLQMHSVKLWETMNCFVECKGLNAAEVHHFFQSPLHADLVQWRTTCGIVEYDLRNVHEAQ